MTEIDALLETLCSKIEKIPHAKARIVDVGSFVMIEGKYIKVHTIIKCGERHRMYDIAFVTFDDTIAVETCSNKKDKKAHIVHFEYADPKSIQKVLEHILKLVKVKLGSLKGSYTSSMRYHEKEIEKAQKFIGRSKIRLEAATEMQGHLKDFKLENRDD